MNVEKLTAIVVLATIIVRIIALIKKARTPVYDPTDAVNVTYAALPDDIKSSIDKKDVSYILDLELQHQKAIGLINNKPTSDKVVVDGEKLNAFILEEAKKAGKTYTKDIVDHVLAAEETYLTQIGAIKK